jgi:serine/threonine protein kinase
MSEPTFTILLVDDNEVIQMTCGRYLEKEGYEVVKAEDGDQALGLLERVRVDLILLDVMMPGLNGFEVLGRVREKHPPEELPVIMATAKDQNKDVVQAFDLGANDYITKPLDFPVLGVRIKAQLRSRQKARTRPGRRVQPASFAVGPGAVLDDKYRLESLIGHGSFGIVYQARHLTLERQVAVKLLERDLGGEEMVERFRQEGVSACRIDHPNAVSVLDSSVSESGVPYLVMELLRGQTLEDEMRRRGRLSPARCSAILGPVCDVLAEAHSLGIIHRDVKPQNVFLHQARQGEVVKVLDFGIAKLVGDPVATEELTPEEGVVGTPIYMAPERFTGEPDDGRSDVYSLGVMVYEMLAGQLPFGDTEGSPIKVVLKHLHEPPIPLRTLCPELPNELIEVVLEALAKHPDERPTAREMGRGFAAAVELPPAAMTENSAAQL